LVAGIAFVSQELRDVGDVLVTASECVFAAHIIDAD
jgi:hypothetical protein